MTVPGRKTARVVTAAVLCIAFVGCGGGGSDATSTAPVVSTNPPVVVEQPEIVTGVALPSTVAVVTATNAT